jgi:hypothetical protein
MDKLTRTNLNAEIDFLISFSLPTKAGEELKADSYCFHPYHFQLGFIVMKHAGICLSIF